MSTNASQERRARDFLALHHAPQGFVLPNAWDAASTVLLVEAGFAAVATTSAGIAFSLAKQDYFVGDDPGVTQDEMFTRLGQIVSATSAPVSADLEDGWGDGPDAAVETVERAIRIGLAGGNIEDRPHGEDRLLGEDEAVARIAAAAATIKAGGRPFVLNARTDMLLAGQDLGACIRRANRFLEAGADCVYTPGAADMPTIQRLAREIEGPLNIVVGLGSAPQDIPAILAAGVKRITVGGSIARATLAFVRRCAQELRERSSIAFAEEQMSQGELNTLFARHAAQSARVN